MLSPEKTAGLTACLAVVAVDVPRSVPMFYI